MAKHCQECHGLQFEPAVSTREVPHGKPAEALTVIEEFYANLALKGVRDSFQKAFGVPGEGLLRRTGEPTAEERRGALALAGRKARQVGEELFKVRVCETCHAVSRDKDEWRIAPVRASQCGDCHDAARSRKASDISIPAIAKCRDCHGGAVPVEGKVTSNCLLCHAFHDERHPWDPNFRPKSRPAVAQRDAH